MNYEIGHMPTVDSWDPLNYLVSTDSKALLKTILVETIDLFLQSDLAGKAYSGQSVTMLQRALDNLEILPNTGFDLSSVIADIGKLFVDNALNVNAKQAMAHLHCPVAVPALAAEVLISATNQSLDTWDQSPIASMIEEQVINWVKLLIGYPEIASGCFTSGGSQSNMTALYLAIENTGCNDRRDLVIYTSKAAHFSIQKSARILGLAADSVVAIPSNDSGELDINALTDKIRTTQKRGKIPTAIIATAGTTDLGLIEPIDRLAPIAEEQNLWLHVDAAYGGGLLFTSERERLGNISKANSITLDFHKMLYQPISCSVIVVKDQKYLEPLAWKADYLNPESEVFAGVPNFVERSFQTTRRSDALKVYMTMRSLGKNGIDALIQQTLANTKEAAKLIEEGSEFELARVPPLSTVVFRFVRNKPYFNSQALYNEVRKVLFFEGSAAIATTVLNDSIYFKFTLLNPRTDRNVIASVLDRIAKLAEQIWRT